VNTKTLIPLAVLGLVFAVSTATAARSHPAPQPTQSPPRTPFLACVAGAGIVEASTENVNVASAISGIVSTVFVKVGDEVAPGAPLFILDERADRATVAVRRAQLLSAEANLERARLAPRPESLPPLEASVRECEAKLEDARVQQRRWEALVGTRAVSEHETSLKRYAELVAERQLEQAKATLAETRAGTWQPDIAIAEAAVAVARAELEQAEVELDRLVVRAPVAARILRVYVHAGELIPADTGAILLGDTDRLHVRVSIDEADVPRFRPGGRARGSIKGLGDPSLTLRFVRTEPYVLPKKSLTGQANERVDTRVLEVIFAIEGQPPVPIFVGQQIDAFIEESRS
jgi:multidrug resistance efflux pump